MLPGTEEGNECRVLDSLIGEIDINNRIKRAEILWRRVTGWFNGLSREKEVLKDCLKEMAW